MSVFEYNFEQYKSLSPDLYRKEKYNLQVELLKLHEDVIKKILDDFQKAKISITYSEIEEILFKHEKDAINKMSE